MKYTHAAKMVQFGGNVPGAKMSKPHYSQQHLSDFGSFFAEIRKAFPKHAVYFFENETRCDVTYGTPGEYGGRLEIRGHPELRPLVEAHFDDVTFEVEYPKDVFFIPKMKAREG